jgi:hypothetical protein
MADDPADERISLHGLDPEDALRGLMRVHLDAVAETKEHKLDWIRKAPATELAIPEVRDKLIQEAREAGASPEEIKAALVAPE